MLLRNITWMRVAVVRITIRWATLMWVARMWVTRVWVTSGISWRGAIIVALVIAGVVTGVETRVVAGVIAGGCLISGRGHFINLTIAFIVFAVADLWVT